jgi:phosphotransacetylase
LKSITQLPEAVRGLLGGGTLKGVVLFPGADSVAALKRMCALFPTELVVYTGPTTPDLSSLSAAARSCETRLALSPATVLRDYLTSELPHCHFVVRGDLLSLETFYKAVHRLGGDAPGASVSQVGLIEMPPREGFFIVSDGFINASPDKNARLNIIRNSVAVWRALSDSPARVALLSAVEQVNPGMPVTVESAEIAQAAGEAVRDAFVQGPLSFDVALDAEAARDKGASGEVAGRANVLVGNAVEVSNGIYVVLTLLPKASAASVVVGGRVPVALPFPSDGIETTFNSVCLAALLGLRRGAP